MSPIQVLKAYFGYSSFRHGQEEIINRIVNGGDCLVLMPTGGGKSVCFQIPALMMEGTAIVISPLISLMKDQVEGLKMNGIAAEALNSNNEEYVNRAVMEKMTRGELKLLYISPERLITDIDWISQQKVSLIAIDEAHCISHWGHDFRPEYTQLGMLHERFCNVPIAAFTATADKITKADIVEQLNLRSPQIFVASFDRPNLSLAVKAGYDKKGKIRAILDIIGRHNDESGIIYCLARKTTEELSEVLREKGVSVNAYHAGLSAAERNRVQEDFINDRVQVICATIAFGMGIDKSNVRFVVHYNMPKSIENFYQEIGRAGRDGLPSETVLFYNLGDIITLQRFVDESGQREINKEKLERMREYAEAKVCRRRILLNYFGENSECGCGNCDVCECPPSLFDGTIIVQKALSAILRTNEQIGFVLLLDILRASANSEVIRRGYHQIKTYGAGRDVPAKDWNSYFLQMLQMGFIEIAYNEDRHLKVTALGREVLKGKSVQLAVPTHEDFRVKKRGRHSRSIGTGQHIAVSDAPAKVENFALFEALRQLRNKIAKQENKPAYIIFSDKSLHCLATDKPTTKEAFQQVWGIGEHKTELFAEIFIEEISKFTSVENVGDTAPTPTNVVSDIPMKFPKKHCIQRDGKQYIIDEEIWQSIEWRSLLNSIHEKAYWNYSGEKVVSLSDYIPNDIADRDRIVAQFTTILHEAYGLTCREEGETIILPQKFDYDSDGRVVELPKCSFEETLTRFRMFVIKHNRFPMMDGDREEISLRKWHREISHGLLEISEEQKMIFNLLATEFPDVPKHKQKP